MQLEIEIRGVEDSGVTEFQCDIACYWVESFWINTKFDGYGVQRIDYSLNEELHKPKESLNSGEVVGNHRRSPYIQAGSWLQLQSVIVPESLVVRSSKHYLPTLRRVTAALRSLDS